MIEKLKSEIIYVFLYQNLNKDKFIYGRRMFKIYVFLYQNLNG